MSVDCVCRLSLQPTTTTCFHLFRGNALHKVIQAPEEIRANSSQMLGLIEDIDLSQIKQSSRPLRAEPGDLTSLAESIARNGLLQPVVVRIINNYFEVVAGHRRFLACKHLSLRKIPCHVTDLSDKEAYELSLVENIQRRSMNPVEEGQAYAKYIEDYGWGGVSELAKVIGKSQEYVSKRIKLLELPEEIQSGIIRHRIKASIGEELAYVKDKETQSGLAKMVYERHVTVKQLRHEISAASQELEIDNGGMDFQQCYSRSIIAYDKAIIVLKLTLRRINDIIESVEDVHWLINGSLLQQRAIISSQIDSLLKEKRKYSKLACTRLRLLSASVSVAMSISLYLHIPIF
jgi:ParB family transcriptional regulator, chromosome partitioning protein